MKTPSFIFRTAVLMLVLCLSLAGLCEEPGNGFAPEGVPDLGALDFPMLTEATIDADDIPEDYLTAAGQQGRVEKLFYTVTETSFDGTSEDEATKSVSVYLPYGYDESEEVYNVLYLLHPSGASAKDYLSRDTVTAFQNVLDHMIENGDMKPLIVVAATYYPSNDFIKLFPLERQVDVTVSFPGELVESIIPEVETRYRTYAASGSVEDIIASRDHRAVSGFSLGGVATWYVFLQEMRAVKWFLPISEASWDDGDGGTTGIMDSELSSRVLYDAVISQGYGKDDFMLFVATGSEDTAFDIATNQMKSLLEYSDMFITGYNTSCSMMLGGMHTMQASYTYLCHIMPSLFAE